MKDITFGKLFFLKQKFEEDTMKLNVQGLFVWVQKINVEAEEYINRINEQGGEKVWIENIMNKEKNEWVDDTPTEPGIYIGRDKK